MRNENQKEIMKILNEVSETLNATSNTLCYNKVEDVKALFKLEFEQKSKEVEEFDVLSSFRKGKTMYYFSKITKRFTKIVIAQIDITPMGNIRSIKSENSVSYSPNELYLSPNLTDKPY